LSTIRAIPIPIRKYVTFNSLYQLLLLESSLHGQTTKMPFQHTLEGLLNKGKAKVDEFTNHSPQSQPQYRPPPPIPTSTKPQRPSIPTSTKPSTSPTTPYWQAAFNPSTSISQIFQQETGAHGWGNNESQNYTTDSRNCFFTPDNKLVLRAIAEPSNENKYTSARLISHQKLDRQRGCLTAILTAPCAAGIWPAFWLLPSQPFTWPNDGEIDIFESWNGDCVNHSCLHWGHYNGEDWNKHRVVETAIPDMGQQAHCFELAWDQPENSEGGRLVWYIDGRAVMKAEIPRGTRRISDWRIILNVAMGGNVCGGKLPADGRYDFVVHELKMSGEPVGGWERFESDFETTRGGKTM
jgi:hypothetical protein